jgi:hypothetical protein
MRPLLNTNGTGRRIEEIVLGLDGPGMEAIRTALLSGLGVLLASTSDGGAVSLTVYDGDDRLRSYSGSSDELRRAMEALKDLGTAKGL